MSNNISKIQKPSWMFVFSDEHQSELFLRFAHGQFNSSIVQHPFSADGRTRDLLRVLVTASGSQIFDISLKNVLEQKAVELGGYYMPKV